MSDRLSIVALFTGASALLAAALTGCASIPDPKFKKFAFPKNAFVGDVQRPYTVLGPVRSKIDYQTLDPNHEEKDLCRNYYNRAVRDLVKFAKKQGGDAVVDVKSVVFLVDGRTETYPTPECSDDGGDGQILTQGVAIKWKGGPVEAGAWSQPPASAPAVAAATPAPLAAAAPTGLAPPSLAHPNAPVFPEGGTLVPEQDEPAEPVAAKLAAPAESTAPVTAKMEAYDPNRSLLSAPASVAQTTPGAQTASPPPRQPAAAPAPAETYPYQLPRQAPSQPVSRLPFADPRAVPGSFQRVTP